MKRNLFLIIFLSTLTIFAQSPVCKGIYSIGGSISFISTSGENDYQSSSDLDIAPIVGYFFIDNVYGGITLNYSYRTIKNSSSESYGFGPTFRYFIYFEDKLVPYFGLGYSFYMLNKELDLSRNAVSASVGADYFIKNYFSIELDLTYRISNYNGSAVVPDLDGKIKQLFFSVGANYFID